MVVPTFSLRFLFSSCNFITSPFIWPYSAFFFSLHFFADLRFCINLRDLEKQRLETLIVLYNKFKLVHFFFSQIFLRKWQNLLIILTYAPFCLGHHQSYPRRPRYRYRHCLRGCGGVVHCGSPRSRVSVSQLRSH